MGVPARQRWVGRSADRNDGQGPSTSELARFSVSTEFVRSRANAAAILVAAAVVHKQPSAPALPADALAAKARDILQATGEPEGYASGSVSTRDGSSRNWYAGRTST